MKKLVMMLVMLGMASPLWAETVTTSSTAVAGHGSHSHTVSIPDAEKGDSDIKAGVGADVVVYRGNTPLLDEVRVDYRYDINNDEHSVFGVVKVDLFDYLTKRV